MGFKQEADKSVTITFSNLCFIPNWKNSYLRGFFYKKKHSQVLKRYIQTFTEKYK